MAARRSYGTGSLYVRVDSAGRESWYGKWHSNGRRVKRRLGPKRAEGSRNGLTRAQAEGELRRLMAEVQATPAVGQSLTVDAAGERYRRHLKRAGRKEALADRRGGVCVAGAARAVLRRQSPRRHPARGVVDLIAVLERKGLSPKSIHNYVGTLSALFNYAKGSQRRWAAVNPCEGVELPGVPDHDEIRFLDEAEWEAVLRHLRAGAYGALDRAFYLTAIMAGLRHGELIALRWRDVDWPAGRIRVRQNFVLGEFDTPKSRRATRSVPMADRLAGKLDRLYKAADEPGDDELVFPDPITGGPLDKAENLRRYPQGAQGRVARRHAQPARAPALVRDPDGRRRSVDANAAGVDGAPRYPDDAAVRRLRAEPARVRADRARMAGPWSRSGSRSERISDHLRSPR